MPADDETLDRYRSKSLWLDQLGSEIRIRPALGEGAECDIVIVGGGFTGLWTAYYLALTAPELRVVVLEQEIVGFGASGRNGGWAGGGIAGSHRRYSQTHGWGAVRRAVAESNAGVAEIGRVVEAERIECGFRQEGSVAVATSRPQQERLLAWFRSQRERRTLGEGERLLGPQECHQILGIPDARRGFITPFCAGMQPARLVRGLAEACERRGVRICEHTPASALGPGFVDTSQGRVRARFVLRATESYTTMLPGQARTYLPLTSLMVSTEALSSGQWAEIGMAPGMTVKDCHRLFFYAQRTWDDRLAIGGRGAPYSLLSPMAESRETNEGVSARLATSIRVNFPAAAGAAITHHWGGTLAVPRDWCMSVSVDQRTGYGEAGGYSGHGVVAANIAGRTLADLVLGRDTPLVRLPWVGHRSRRWEREPARFIASRAIVGIAGSADRHEDAHQTSARRAALIGPFLPPA